jgi:phage terminase small subunit
MKMHKDRLTERQRLFCEMYIGPGRHCAALAARLAGYAPGCSHVTGCQLLKKPKIAATVRGLEGVLAKEIGVSRQAVIAQLVGAAEMAKLMMEPGQIVSALRQIALMSGYYRQEEVAHVKQTDGQSVVQANFLAMTDEQLTATILAGAAA